jgi:hypothetical protein
MFKLYLENRAYWFATETERNDFKRLNPTATIYESKQYFNGKEWVNKEENISYD